MFSRLSRLLPQSFKNLYHLFVAVAANFYYSFPARSLIVIGVTGTDGKTTTSHLIHHFLEASGYKAALISTVSAKIGDTEIDTGFHVTSPDPWPLQKLLRRIVAQNYGYVVLETTSHGLHQHRFWGVPFRIGVLTNVSLEHLDYHHTPSSYLKAKAKLFRHARHAVLNQDDPNSYSYIKTLLPPKISLHPYSLRAIPPTLLRSLKDRFKEPFNQENGLAAATAANLLGVSEESISHALTAFPGVPGRLEEIPNPYHFTTIVDFAHTPNGLKRTLTALKKRRPKGKKLIAVFGAAGLRDKSKRPLMGEIGSLLADIIILTAEDPRTENVADIISQIRAGAKGPAGILIEPDRQKAIDLAIVNLARPGDIVAVLGKGHEQSMCFGTIESPWSDHEAIRKALAQKKSPA
ncbi:MAG: UDP-N-acetylmuramoyl-L-alanyl-D-glutamate--2,6-diaminopimelate ligase [Candidatus Chisholmbacteria bacterium]|nr:UDP-N-acetylmuramoyl-L-alanyl-D-glutamate--2,6-diaminopimelate ligase [Candidatus Chisholmbacteria bacterium]